MRTQVRSSVLLVALVCVFIASKAQDTLKSTTKPQSPPTAFRARTLAQAVRDSGARSRARHRRNLDSLRRTLKRDSLRAGFSVHFNGRLYKITSSRGRRLHDSLATPGRFRRFAERRDSARKDSTAKGIAGISTEPGAQDSLRVKPAERQTDTNLEKGLQAARAIVRRKEAKKKDSLRLMSKGEEVAETPFFIQNYHLRTKAQINRLETEAWIDRTFNLNQAKKLFLTFPPPVKPQEVKIKGRPFVRTGTKHEVRPFWIILVLFLVMLLIAIVKSRYPRDLQEIFESLFSDRIIRNNREAGILYSPSFFFMFFGFCLVSGLLIYDYVDFRRIDMFYKDFGLYLILTGSVLGFFILKLLVYRASALVFNIDLLVKPYLTFLYVTVANFTIASLPFLIFFSFYSTAFRSKMVSWIPFIFVVFLTFLYLRSLVYSITNFQFQKFYLFLYFCTFEICPLVIVFKLING